MSNKIYTGVGSRETPEDILQVMVKIGKYLATQGWTLRSGGAIGADRAFERGCDIGKGKKEIYYAKGNKGVQVEEDKWEEAMEVASKIHPAWHRCNEYARRLHARNCFQVGGRDLRVDSDILICWTKDGRTTGGTATAIKLAESKGIEVYNLFFKERLEQLRGFLL